MKNTLDTSREELIEILLKKKKQQALSKDGPAALSRDGVFPLSYVQERLWLVQERDKNNAYNLSGAVTFEGPLSLEALKDALDLLIERHEPLRSRFVVAPGEFQPHQKIEPTMRAALLVRDMREEKIAQLVGEHAEQIFDLEHGSLFSVLLLRLTPSHHVLSLTMHHIIADGWSLGILTRDMQELYAAKLEQREALLPPLKIQYADYAVWQRKQDLSGSLAYWTSALAGCAGPIDLAPESPRGKVPGQAGIVKRTLPAELAAAIGRFGQERQASLFMMLLSGWALLIYRQTRQTDLCLGTTAAGREQLALEPLIGFFINILALRVDLSGEPTGEQVLEQVKQVVLDGLAHQSLPFEHLLAEVPGLRQEDGSSPLPVMLRHQNYPEADVQHWAGGLQARSLANEQVRPAKCDLDLQYYGDATGLSVVAEFDMERFDVRRVEAFLLQLESLLAKLIERPSAPLSRLVESTVKEQTQLNRWNETVLMFGQTSVTELFAKQVAKGPDSLACRDGERNLTYAELDRRSDNLARVLEQQGVGPEVRVALYLPRGVDLLTALLAVFKARGVYVPVDPSYPDAYVRRIMQDAQPAVILVASTPGPSFETAQAKVLPIEETLLERKWEPREEGPAAGPDDLAYIAYTSGSTGEPKGVCVEHGQLLNCLQALWAKIPFESDEVVVQKTATTFVVSLKELLAGLLIGIPQVIVSDLLVRDTPAFAATLEQHRVTRLNLVPSHLAVLLEYADRLTGLRHVVTAGEPLSQRLRERFEQLLPGVRLYNNYGCTELNDITYCVSSEQDSAGVMVPMGRPIANLRVYVLDEQQRLVPVGVAGELYVKGAAVGRRGYWNQPQLNAERFLRNPFDAGASRLFRTGDLVRRRPDGQLEYLGRADFQIKIRGQRIDVAQVEQALSEHPSVVRCAVMGQDSGTEQALLVAYYVAAPETEPNHNQLHAWMRDRLPAYMVPAAYVRLEILPLLPNGKLDRNALPALDTDAYSQQGYEEPQGEVERRVAAVWAEVLNLPVDRIGRHDNFFAIGGNSLRAVQVMRGLSEQVGYRDLSIQIMFENSILKKLASRLETPILSTKEWQSFARVLPLRASGTEFPLFCIHPIIGVGWAYAGLLPVIDSNRPIYAIQARGFEGESLPNSMEEMVSDYIAIIRRIQPSGPYHLCGWSFGGFVAHAIATQLQATNETVNFLGVLDTFFPNKHNQASNADLHRMVRLLIVQSLLDFGIDKSSISEVLINRILDVVENNAALLSGYSPQTFAGKMLFVRATIISSRILGDLVSNRPLDHWGPYVTEAIECVDLEATHFTLLQGANGILVGKMFNAALASPSPDSTSINLKD